MPDEAIEQLRRMLASSHAPIGVWPENVATVEAFLCVSTQWRTAAISHMAGGKVFFVGLDYAGARIGLEASGVAISPELWAGLQVMEEASRDALNEGSG